MRQFLNLNFMLLLNIKIIYFPIENKKKRSKSLDVYIHDLFTNVNKIHYIQFYLIKLRH